MDREPEVEMTFVVRAKELRFECTPEVDVVAYADSPARAELESERKNLPQQVEEGVTYRDVEVRWRTAAWLGEPDWDEALSGGLRTRRLRRGDSPQDL